MHRKLSKFVVGAITVALILGVSARADAVPITGNITFAGEFSPTGGTDLSDATGIDILGDIAVVVCALLSTCGGDYATLNGFLIGASYNDFTFAPLGGGITPLWSLVFGPNTYSFDLTSATIISQTAAGIVLVGSGFLNITGFDTTPGAWSFSGDQSGATFAFSATNVAIPEPASIMLFGLSLLGGGLALHRLNRRKRA